MRIKKVIYFLLFLVSFTACDRMANEPPQFSEPIEQSEKNIYQSETSAELVEDSQKSESGNFDGKTPLKEEKNQTEISTDYQEKRNLNSQLPFLFLSFTWDTWILIFSILTLILIILLVSLFRKNWTLNDSVDEKNEKLDTKNGEIRQLQVDIQKIQSELYRYKDKENLQNQKRKATSQEKIPKPNQELKNDYPDEKIHEVVWPVNEIAARNISQDVKQAVSLFAEKANEDRTFDNVSDQKNEHRSVFKLLLENEQADTAQFEVVDSDFILKMAANSPDTYLYTVCKPENSNQNFAGEIITTQKGIAHKVDGKWQVKDENKAKIKFQ